MKPGQQITVNAFGGEEIDRIFIQMIDNTVVICKQEEWNQAQTEGRKPNGVGFPLRSVKHKK